MQHITLKELRKRRRLSVAKLAKQSGVNRSTVARIENGEVRPLHQTVVALEQVLRGKFSLDAR